MIYSVPRCPRSLAKPLKMAATAARGWARSQPAGGTRRPAARPGCVPASLSTQMGMLLIACGWAQTHPRLAMSGLGSRRVASACFQRRDSDATASALVLTRETARHRPARRTPLRVQLGSHLEVAACFGSRPISGGKPTNTPGGRVLEFRAWQHVTLVPAAYRGGTEIGVARSGSRSSRWSRAWIERTRRSRVS